MLVVPIAVLVVGRKRRAHALSEIVDVKDSSGERTYIRERKSRDRRVKSTFLGRGAERG